MASDTKSTATFSTVIADLFNVVSVIKFLGVIVIACFILWMNSRYVTRAEYTSLSDRVVITENKIVADDSTNNQIIMELKALQVDIKNLDSRLSNFVTPNGQVIYEEPRLQQLETNVKLMQQDLQYIKAALDKRP